MTTVLSNVTAIGIGIKSPFVGTGGTGPYTYAVLPGGAGGTIDANGLYTAPNVVGTDTIEATDALNAKGTKSIAVLHPMGLLCDIIQTEMNLSDDQVYLYNQTFRIPPDNRLYIAIGIGNIKPFSNVIRADSSGSGIDGVQYANFKSNHEINIMSSTEEAIFRKEELMMAFVSYYSKNQQAANSFHVAPLPDQFNNLSEVEGEKIPYRFNINVNMQYAIKKIKASAYYDTINEPNVITNT